MSETTWLFYLRPVQPETRHLTTLCLDFLFYKMGTITQPTIQGCSEN